MGTSDYSYSQIVDFLFPIWMILLIVSFIIGILYVYKSISTERKKTPTCCTEENHKHKYYIFTKVIRVEQFFRALMKSEQYRFFRLKNIHF